MTYDFVVPSNDVAQGKASPHAGEGEHLPASMDEPLSEEWHQKGSYGVHDGPDNSHEDTVRKQHLVYG